MNGSDNTETSDWQELAQLMSDISEEAFYAGWMDQLEYDLWAAIHEGRPKYGRKYGQITLGDEQVRRLLELSERLGGWVWFNEELGLEEFNEHDRWAVLFADWLRQRSHT